MTNFVDVTYQQTGKSLDIDSLGMREMQRRAFEERNAQYLLLKAPPASGKSRALMFIALHKLKKQGIKKVIVAVPEKSIGASFEYYIPDRLSEGYGPNKKAFDILKEKKLLTSVAKVEVLNQTLKEMHIYIDQVNQLLTQFLKIYPLI